MELEYISFQLGCSHVLSSNAGQYLIIANDCCKVLNDCQLQLSIFAWNDWAMVPDEVGDETLSQTPFDCNNVVHGSLRCIATSPVPVIRFLV